VIATGFEANSIFQPYKPGKKSRVELFPENSVVPPKLITERAEGEMKVLDKKHRTIISDFEEESQGTIDFGHISGDGVTSLRDNSDGQEDEVKGKSDNTLKKVKHMQNILKKEGLSNKTMKDNIDTFEDVPAYIRRNMMLNPSDKNSESKLSKFTLTSDDEEGPVLRENNAYLNDNVD
jgi:hypothetical protein